MTCTNTASTVGITTNVNSNACKDEFNCDGTCPDFLIKRFDTQPNFKVAVSTCDGPLSLTGLVLEASMWANAKFKKDVLAADTYFALSQNRGFQQALVGDIIVVDRVRHPEQMLIIGFDETLKLIQVQRGYNGTSSANYPKGTAIRIFRVLNAVAQTEMTFENQLQFDGSVLQNVLVKSELVYAWQVNDTCTPGCYDFEFKLLTMSSPPTPMVGSLGISLPSVPSFASFTPSQYGCIIGTGVSAVRRFPTEGAFRIKVCDTATSENLT